MTTTPPPPPPEGQPYGTTWHDPEPTGGPTAGHPGWGPGHPAAPPVPPPPPQPQPQRSWFRRHKILTALLVLVGIIAVSNMFGNDEPTAPETAAVAPADPTDDAAPAKDAGTNGDDSEAPADADPTDEAPADEASAPAEDEDEVVEDTAAEPSTEAAPAADGPGLGDAVRDGQFEFVVTEVEPGLATIGEGFSEQEAQGQFVIVHLSVTNIGDSAQTLFDNDQLLIDEQGRKHSTSSASMWLEEGIWLDEINPGNSMEGVLLYDIPVDATPTALELHDSMFSGGVTVSLQ